MVTTTAGALPLPPRAILSRTESPRRAVPVFATREELLYLAGMTRGLDSHWLGQLPVPRRVRGRVTTKRTSFHLTMRDGVRIALDLHLPTGSGIPERMPSILRQTRYLRSLEPRWPFGTRVAGVFDLYAHTRQIFLQAGYVWVNVDVRGTGASSGSWPSPWYLDEVRDGAEIVDHVITQPWSNGRVGSLGISYDGTSAEMLLINRHPAVRAVAPMFSLFDVYADVAFPGGVQLEWFTRAWAEYNALLDRNAFAEAWSMSLWFIGRAGLASPTPRGLECVFAPLASAGREAFTRRVGGALGRMIRGVRSVDSDADRTLLESLLPEHAENQDVHQGAQKMRFRDDVGMSHAIPDAAIDSFSPHAYRDEVEGSGAAIYSYSGWRDGAYQRAAIQRFASLRTPGSRLTIGPWVHSGKLFVEPFELAQGTAFDHDAELLSFFDAHLLGEPLQAFGDGRSVHYFTTGERRWKASDEWPPSGEAKVLFLESERRLSESSAATAEAFDTHLISAALGSGERSRWRSLLSLVPGDYPDRRARDAVLLTYDTPALDLDMEVTGYPAVRLFVSWDDPDGAQVIAYLEEVRPDGEVAYITEGILAALHRSPERTFRREHAAELNADQIVEMAFELLPCSHLFRRGNSIRLSIAGADGDHFRRPSARSLQVHRSQRFPSRLELPVV